MRILTPLLAYIGLSYPACAQQTAPSLPRLDGPGIYLALPASPEKPLRIEATIADINEVYKVRFSFDLTQSAFNLRAVLPGAAAKLRIADRHPVFFFHIGAKGAPPPARAPAQPFLTSRGQLFQSPFEFRLVRLEIRNGDRAAFVGRMSIVGGTSGKGAKSLVAFNSSAIAPGLFRLTLNDDLSPGNYAFVNTQPPPNSGQGLSDDTVSDRVYDFTVE